MQNLLWSNISLAFNSHQLFKHRVLFEACLVELGVNFIPMRELSVEWRSRILMKHMSSLKVKSILLLQASIQSLGIPIPDLPASFRGKVYQRLYVLRDLSEVKRRRESRLEVFRDLSQNHENLLLINELV
jgi:hypothetical protein